MANDNACVKACEFCGECYDYCFDPDADVEELKCEEDEDGECEELEDEDYPDDEDIIYCDECEEACYICEICEGEVIEDMVPEDAVR